MKTFLTTTFLTTTVLAAAAAAQSAAAPTAPSPASPAEQQHRMDRIEMEQAAAEHAAAAARGRIGVTLGRIHEALAAQLNLSAEEVVLIERVLPDAPAEAAGVEAYDIIIKVNGQSPVTDQSLRQVIRATEPGETVRLTVLRGGKAREIKVPVEAAEPEQQQNVFHFSFTGEPEELADKLSEALAGHVAIDPEALERLQMRVERWVTDPEFSQRFNFENLPHTFRWRGREVEIERDGDDAVRMWMRPTAPAPPVRGGLGAAPGKRLNANANHQRFEQIEQRLERIEQMLEKLVESQG